MNTRASFLIALALALPAMAHEGEDHGAPAEAAPADVSRAPRAATATETFALLAVGGPDGLTLYLDDAATNAPVDGARLEVQGDGWKAGADRLEAGVYQFASDRFASPGSHPLTVVVQTDDSADLMTLTLEIPGDATVPRGTAETASRNARLVWGASGAVVLAGAGFLAVRRRNRRLRPESGSK
ncbi:MAG: hypothetical protein M5U30_12940 [Burkholderiaceae bacterium]|nr:hypothetical protein [Burkholderiaceae bacterium]